MGLAPLAGALGPTRRARLASDLRALLRFRRVLGRFPSVSGPDATPIMTAYRDGRLVGCVIGRRGATGGERLARTFLELTSPLDGPLSIEVVYATTARRLASPSDLELGEEGVAVERPDDVPIILLPQIARDFGADGATFVEMLRQKARGFPAEPKLAAWRVDRVVARDDDVEETSGAAARRTGADGADYAAAWLARLVDRDGEVAFAIDAGRRLLEPVGDLHHARTAVAVEALAAHGGYDVEVQRARRRLVSDARRALRTAALPGWPTDPAAIAGTLALAVRAGADLRRELVELATHPALERAAWHAAQVIYALGAEAPARLVAICREDLRARPFAPWTALAARHLGDRALERASIAALSRLVRRRGPFVGGVDATSVPETGLTAVAAHALALHPSTRTLAHAALGFVEARQLLPGRIPAALDPTLALGGFSATPVNDLLRADIAGHALLALLAEERGD